MADRDALALLIANEVAEAISNMDAGNKVADALLGSDWLAEHDRQVERAYAENLEQGWLARHDREKDAEIERLRVVRDAVLRYARERQAYGSRSMVGSLRVASDLLGILGEPWDEPTSTDTQTAAPGLDSGARCGDSITSPRGGLSDDAKPGGGS